MTRDSMPLSGTQGTFLDAVLQECLPCDSHLVSLSSGATACVPCSVAEARVNASSCALCPDNSKTSPTEPSRCACVFGYYDALFGASLLTPQCMPCPVGGVCDTGFVAADNGYWRESVRSDQFLKCREGKCVAEVITGPYSPEWSDADSLAALELGGAPGTPANGSGVVSFAPTNCVEGSDGPLCALCLPGYTLQSGECAPCDPADAWPNWSAGAKAGLLIACLLFALVFIAFAFFQPIVPALERAADGALAAAKACFGRVKQCASCGRAGRQHPEDAPPTKAVEDSQAAELRMEERSGATVPAAVLPAATTSGGGEKHDGHTDAVHHGAHQHAARHGVAHNDGGPVGDARAAALVHQRSAAFAGVAGTAGAMTGADFSLDDGDMEDDDEEEDMGRMEDTLDFMDMLEEMTERVSKYFKARANGRTGHGAPCTCKRLMHGGVLCAAICPADPRQVRSY